MRQPNQQPQKRAGSAPGLGCSAAPCSSPGPGSGLPHEATTTGRDTQGAVPTLTTRNLSFFGLGLETVYTNLFYDSSQISKCQVAF